MRPKAGQSNVHTKEDKDCRAFKPDHPYKHLQASPSQLGFPGGSAEKTACNAGDVDLVAGWGRSPGEGNGNPTHYSCLGNPTDRGAWQTTVHGIARAEHDLATKPPPPLPPQLTFPGWFSMPFHSHPHGGLSKDDPRIHLTIKRMDLEK